MARTGATLFQYLVAVAFTALMVVVRWLLDPVLGDYVPFGLIYGAVAFAVWVGGFRAALLAATVGYFATDYLLVEPRGTLALALHGIQDYFGVAFYVLSCMIIIGFGERMRVAQRREADSRWRLAELTEQIRIVTESMDAPVIRCSRDLRYLWVNKPYADWLGRTVEEIVGHQIIEIIGPEGLKRKEPYFKRVLAGEKVTYEEAVNFAGIGPRCISATYTPTSDASGAIDGWVAVVIDVTERKRFEQNLRESDRHKDEFLAMLAHELRNPLSPIRNALELQKMAGDDKTLLEDTRAIMERQVEQLVHLVNDLMDVSRIKTGKFGLHKKPVRLIDILQQAVESSRPLIEAKHQSLSMLTGSEQIVVDADAARLAQVFSNLLNNSVKYTNRDGQIKLTVTLEGSDVIVSVEDTGIGISNEMLPFVFDMFAQAEKLPGKTVGGLGIGLTLAKQIVEMHGGRINVRSEGLGKGSEFSVRLPIVVSQHAVQTIDQSHENTINLPRRRVLVVDDMKDSAQVLADLLVTKGQEATVVFDGPAAIKAAIANRPEIVFIDLGMPGMNGYEVAERLRARPELSRTLLVALTGYVQEESRSKALHAGFDRYLLKPASMKELEQILIAGVGFSGEQHQVKSDQVIASYHRCRQSGAFVDTFYDIFLRKSPEIAAKFVHTDFARQKLMLRQSLLEMLNYYGGIESVREEIEQLGKRHHQLEVRAEHYEQWLDSLCEAVARHDPEYRDDLGEMWREAMRPGIALMLSVKEEKG
jgi:PAS domain S-box-containing protein